MVGENQMAMNPLHTIQAGVYYIHKADHRNRSPRKSQWTIPENEERSVFSQTYSEGWYEGTVGWGLRLAGQTVSELGVGVDRIRRLFIAKFIDGSATSQWHGYPADYLAHQQDVPDPGILLEWCALRHINPAKMRKILQRKPCNL